MSVGVLITGAQGAVGRRLVERLAELTSVVAIDIKEPAVPIPGVIYDRVDMRDRGGLARILAQHKPASVVHLAGTVAAGGDPALDYEIDVGGIENLLAAMAETGIDHLIVTSSGAAYGYHADNPVPLTEDAALRGNDDFPYARHKRLIEERLQSAMRDRADLKVLILRPGSVLGPGFNNQITQLFARPALLAIAGHPSPFVFVWIDDLVDILVKAVRERRSGIYNVAGDGWLKPAEIALMTGQRLLTLPAVLVKGAIALARRLGKTKLGPEQVKFLQFRPVLSNARLKRDFDLPKLSSRQALALFLASRKPQVAKAVAPPGHWLIVGAGPAGLAVARNFKTAGISYDQIDAQSDVGGLWLYGGARSTVYASTHLISSKRTTEFPDFPMADDLAPYPSHAQVLDYFRAYVDHFGLRPQIRFDTALTRLTRHGEGWQADFSTGVTTRYDGVIIANGHLFDPAMPDLPGAFNGQVLHSKAYKTADIFRGRRVLIVGSGNTGCDVVVDAVHQADKVFWSVRSGNWFVPKFIAGTPADAGRVNPRAIVLPRPIRDFVHQAVLRLLIGPPDQHGLPRPTHRLYDRTPIVNSQVLHYLGQGDVTLKALPQSYDGDEVVFGDGSRERIDLVLYCTGYKSTFPFVDPAHLNWQGGYPTLAFNMFPPQDEKLYVAGLISAAGAGWGARDLQAKLLANYITAQKDRPGAAAMLKRAIAADFDRTRPADQPLFYEFTGYKALLTRLVGLSL